MDRLHARTPHKCYDREQVAAMKSAMEPTSSIDEIIALYKQGIDVTLIDENLRLTPSERLMKLQDFAKFLEAVREAGRRLKGNS